MQKKTSVLMLMALSIVLRAEDCDSEDGVITYQDGAMEGYTLLSDGTNDLAVLIDMDGEIINEWDVHPMPVKMLPGGDIVTGLGLGTDTPIDSPESVSFIQTDWDGELEWSYDDWDDNGTGTMMARQHHDFQREGNPVGYYAPGQDALPQGKTLILVHKNKVVPSISDREIQDDVIIEVDSSGQHTGFEWHAADHVDELGFDEAARAALYADPNYDEATGVGDWLHTNSMSYLGQNRWFDATGDARFDPANIIISSRNANIVAIIDRDTGKVVWRVGPDFSEGRPEHGLGQFQGQHHAHMIPKGLPGEGNILLFDNGGESGYGPAGYPQLEPRGWSRLVEFDPITLKIVWEYGGDGLDLSFYSIYLSSAQRLPNGNTFVTAGALGRLFEVTPDKRIVWDYFCPTSVWIYRAYRIPPEWLPKGKGRYDAWSTYGTED